ncbi:MAG TPA: (p)ppGpp synthetase [Desulfobulbus sp.]|nr:(p)ppGpp synthetase [Desulfobulbus sp.]
MAWPTPIYSKSKVNKAGKILVNLDDHLDDFMWAFDVVNNWRACHGYPINTFQATLRQKLKNIDSKALVAQRMKRMPSIVSKLRRIDGMQLARMQDIGGLRAVVSTLKKVRQLRENYEKSRFAHIFFKSKDYIASPKQSGYRSIHLVYKYKNKNNPAYDGLFVELQIRTRMQHAWATAVETMGTFLNHSLKSSEGPKDWLDFFSLAGSAFAYHEGTPPVPGYDTFSQYETVKMMKEEAQRLKIKNKLRAFSVAAKHIQSDRKSGSYHLIILDPTEKIVTVKSFSQKDLYIASKEYTKIEQSITEGASIQTVLVSAGHIDNLRRAYPNFFLDTREFITYMNRIENKI